MARYTAEIEWRLQPGEDFLKGRYSRGHEIRFDGGIALAASASPHVVGKWAIEAAADPEELLIAALANCHMLSFLHVARDAGFLATAYTDAAEGMMGEIAPGRQAITHVTLRPRITWEGAAPDAARLAQMHHEAHEICYIANSVRTEITIAAPGA
jgi:organic hydroperoxide reductase OsmC/OhrA